MTAMPDNLPQAASAMAEGGFNTLAAVREAHLRIAPLL
jgi:hypothetical protein